MNTTMKTQQILVGSLLALGCALALPGLALADPSSDSDPALTQNVTANEASAESGERVVIEHGHVDIGPRYTNNTWSVLARDDSAQAPVWRNLDDVVFALPDAAKLEVPEGEEYSFIGASQAWVVPQQEIAGVPWLGWNTQDPGVVENVPASLDIVYEGHEGPGHFIAFVQAGNFKGPQILWDSEKKQSQPLSVDVNTHTHANWAFTEPGVHRVTLAFTATLKDGTPVGGHATLNFAVGSHTSPASVFEAVDAGRTGAEAGASLNGSADGSIVGAQSGAEDGASKDGEAQKKGTGFSSSPTLWIVLGAGLFASMVPLIAASVHHNTKRAQEEALQ